MFLHGTFYTHSFILSINSRINSMTINTLVLI